MSNDLNWEMFKAGPGAVQDFLNESHGPGDAAALVIVPEGLPGKEAIIELEQAIEDLLAKEDNRRRVTDRRFYLFTEEEVSEISVLPPIPDGDLDAKMAVMIARTTEVEAIEL